MTASWDAIRDRIQPQIPSRSFSLWINPITVADKRDDILVLACPNKFSREWVRENYLEIMSAAAREAGISGVDLVLQTRHAPPDEEPRPPLPQQLPLPSLGGGAAFGRLTLNRDYTFDRFVVGQCNEFAYSACRALVSNNNWNYHSLMMLADTGLGKTHLAQAIGHSILQEQPRTRVHYMTAENFTNEMITALRNSRIDAFKNKYRKACDVLLLEEVHFLSGKEKTQVELGHTLDALANDHKRLIFTSAFPPKDIPRMSGDLSSRLSAGVVTAISSPDYDTRVRILKHKAEELHLDLADTPAHLIAGRIKNDVRKMESALKCLKAKSELMHAKIDARLVNELLNCLASSEPTIRLEDVAEVVCKYFKVEKEMLRSKSRKKIHAYPRNIYVYLCRHHTTDTLEHIAKSVNRTHSTALYAAEMTRRRLKSDARMRHQLDFLSKHLEGLKA